MFILLLRFSKGVALVRNREDEMGEMLFVFNDFEYYYKKLKSVLSD
jgi:hypothetical protein